MLPPSEYRRVYMRTLIRDIELTMRISPKEAREMATFLVVFLRTKMARGEEVDLGFAALQLKNVKARQYSFNLNGKGSGMYIKGEGGKWVVNIRQSWLKKASPSWSH